MQPAPYGSGNGLHKATSQRAWRSLCGPPTPAPPEAGLAGAAARRRCVACRVSVVEVEHYLYGGCVAGVLASIALAQISFAVPRTRRGRPLLVRAIDHHLGSCDYLRQAQRDLRARAQVLICVRGLLCDAHLPSRRQDAQPTQPHVGRTVRAESRRPRLLRVQELSDLGDAARPDARRALLACATRSNRRRAGNVE